MTVLEPFACGVEGLAKVAAKYVRTNRYPNLAESMQSLRWSVPDSPYAGQLTTARINDAFFRRISPTDADLPEAKGAHETRARVNAAVEALRGLDAEELFGADGKRQDHDLDRSR